MVEFLHQQGIVYGNPDEILFDLDNRVQIVNPLKIDDETVDNGLLGIIAYVCSRVIGCVNRNKEIPFDGSFIEGLQIKYSNVVSENRISNFLTDILYSLPNLGNDNKYIITKKCFLDIISNSSYKDGIICLTIKNLLLEDILLQ